MASKNPPINKEMRPRRIEISAPHGHKVRTIRALRDAGVTVSRDRWTGREEGYWSPARKDKPVDRGAVVALAREGMIKMRPPFGRFGRRNDADRLRPLTNIEVATILSRERLEAACGLNRGARVGVYRVSGDDAVWEILRRVGPAGEQARVDEARYFESFDEVQYDSRNHHGRDWREVSLAVVGPTRAPR